MILNGWDDKEQFDWIFFYANLYYSSLASSKAIHLQENSRYLLSLPLHHIAYVRKIGRWADSSKSFFGIEAPPKRTKDKADFSKKHGYRILGRKDRMFISGGENIYPEEIEKALLMHTEIIYAKVVAIKMKN